jgi:hypothetical protein
MNKYIILFTSSAAGAALVTLFMNLREKFDSVLLSWFIMFIPFLFLHLLWNYERFNGSHPTVISKDPGDCDFTRPLIMVYICTVSIIIVLVLLVLTRPRVKKWRWLFDFLIFQLAVILLARLYYSVRYRSPTAMLWKQNISKCPFHYLYKQE